MAAKAEVEFDASKILPNQIANSITDLGFPASVIDGETGAGEIELEVRERLVTHGGYYDCWSNVIRATDSLPMHAKADSLQMWLRLLTRIVTQ